MDRVIAAQVYNRICELGSLSAAARALGISRPMVSRYLEQMEKWAGTRLVNRSTRKLTLTAAGEKVLQKTRTLSQISQEIEGQSEKDLPSGTLRVACAHFTAMHLIAPVLPGLLSRYPQLRIELDVNNHPVSLVGERIDVAVRITDNPEPGMIARRLGECRSVLCASPDYLARRGPLTHPRQLVEHRSITHRAWSEWLLRSESEDYRYLPDNAHMTDNLVYARECAIAGAGITLLPAFLLEDKVEKGALVQVLPEWNVEGNDLWLAYPSRKLNSPALMSYIEFAMQFDEVKRYYVGK